MRRIQDSWSRNHTPNFAGLISKTALACFFGRPPVLPSDDIVQSFAARISPSAAMATSCVTSTRIPGSPPGRRSRLGTADACARTVTRSFDRVKRSPAANRRRKIASPAFASNGDASSFEAEADDLTTGDVHGAYLHSVASLTVAPDEMRALLKVLQAQGATVVRPSARENLHPLCIPLAVFADGTKACLKLNVEDGGVEVVRVAVGGMHLQLLARTSKEYVHKALVEEEAVCGESSLDSTSDSKSKSEKGPIRRAAGEIGDVLYEPGSFTTLGKDLPVYLTLRVGKFPCQMEGLVQKHLSKDPSDELSAIVTCDLYKATFPFWGRPHWYVSNVYHQLHRDEESRDCARFALTDCEWSTVGSANDLKKVLTRSGWSGKTVDEIKEIIDTRRGPDRNAFDAPKTETEMATELAATLLDKAALGELSVKEIIQRLAECYSTAEKPGLAKLVMSAFVL